MKGNIASFKSNFEKNGYGFVKEEFELKMIHMVNGMLIYRKNVNF